MLYPLIGPRLHGWLDELVALFYVVGALALGLTGAARLVAFGGALVHFTLTRFTNYPQGTWKVLSFRTHAYLELAEGLVVLSAALFFLGELPVLARALLIVMGASQLVAFAFSDYGIHPRPVSG